MYQKFHLECKSNSNLWCNLPFHTLSCHDSCSADVLPPDGALLYLLSFLSIILYISDRDWTIVCATQAECFITCNRLRGLRLTQLTCSPDKLGVRPAIADTPTGTTRVNHYFIVFKYPLVIWQRSDSKCLMIHRPPTHTLLSHCTVRYILNSPRATWNWTIVPRRQIRYVKHNYNAFVHLFDTIFTFISIPCEFQLWFLTS